MEPPLLVAQLTPAQRPSELGMPESRLLVTLLIHKDMMT